MVPRCLSPDNQLQVMELLEHLKNTFCLPFYSSYLLFHKSTEFHNAWMKFIWPRRHCQLNQVLMSVHRIHAKVQHIKSWVHVRCLKDAHLEEEAQQSASSPPPPHFQKSCPRIVVVLYLWVQVVQCLNGF